MAPSPSLPADVDGDGDIDALSASTVLTTPSHGTRTPVLNGDGTSWTTRTITTSADGALSVFAADVDGDGDVDALSASDLDDTIAWYENADGNGTSWIAHSITTEADRARSVFASDVDGDGDIDVLSASFFDNTIAWYENTNQNGDGTSWTTRTITTSADGALSVFAADVDGDGDVDALSASDLDDTIAWYENADGNGTSWIAHSITTEADRARSVFASDVDGDGDIDVLSASFIDNTIAWYENVSEDGTSWTTHTITTGAVGATSVFAADLDGDGDIDALSTSYGGYEIAWFENTDGDGTSWTAHPITTDADYAESVFAADVDGDGDIDALSASYFDNTIAWYENQIIHRSAVFPEETVISQAANGALAVSAADIDGDGDVDTLSGSRYDGKVAWYENTDGSGAFGAQQIITSTGGIYAAASVIPADLDHDGDINVLAGFFHYGSYTLGRVAWYENTNGDGSSWTEQIIASGSSYAQDVRSVFAADVDGDGDLDVLSTSRTDDKIAWYENTDGQGNFGPQQLINTTANNPVSVFAADVDGDGDTDVLSGLKRRQPNRLV